METIMLWVDAAVPYAAECGDQAAPSIVHYPCAGAKCAVLVCPGGGYTHKAAHEGGPIAEMFNRAGIAAAVLDYRVNPCPHEAPLTDAQRAIRTLRAIGYEKVGILGFSAGGNLACNAAVHFDAGDAESADPVARQSCRPDALISCYSVVSLTQHTHVGSLCQLLGERSGDFKLQRYYSAERHVDENTPPAFIWHTAEDGSVPVENSISLAAAYSRAGVPFELHIFPEGRHGIGLAQGYSAEIWPQLCCAWLKRMGF